MKGLALMIAADAIKLRDRLKAEHRFFDAQTLQRLIVSRASSGGLNSALTVDNRALRQALAEVTDLAELLASEVPITAEAMARIRRARQLLPTTHGETHETNPATS